MLARKNKIILIVILFILIFLAFFWRILSINILTVFSLEKTLWERWTDSPAVLYNLILKDPASRRDSTYDILITRLQNISLSEREAERLELIGDLAYKAGKNHDIVIDAYRSSLQILDVPRVREKLTLTWEGTPPLSSGSISTGATLLTGSSNTSTGISELREASERIETDASNRWLYLERPRDTETIIRDTIDFLDTSKEQKDW